MSQVAVAEKMPQDVAPRSQGDAMVSMLERVLMDPSVPVERLERLLELQDKERARQAKEAFIISMSEMQPLLPTIDRNGTIVIHNKEDLRSGSDNPRIVQQTKFATWEDIAEALRPILGEHGFTLTFSAGRAGDQVVITGILRHRDGHEETTTLPLAIDNTGSKNNVQGVGSSISYGKRYTAGMLLNIVSRAKQNADDDGKAAGDPSGPARITEDQVMDMRDLLSSTGADVPKFLEAARVGRLEDIPATRFKPLCDAIKRMADRRANEGSAS